MSELLTALLGVLLLPLFVATWRMSLLGLACQGFLMGWIALRLHPHPGTAGDWLTLADLFLVRGVGAPLALYSFLRWRHTPRRNDVIPANLLSWTVALGMVLVAFNFAGVLVPVPGGPRTLVAVATAGVLLGFLVLATQSRPLSQMIGVLRIENAIALLELGHEGHAEPIGVRLGQTAVLVGTIALFRWYLGRLSVEPAGVPDGPPEVPAP